MHAVSRSMEVLCPIAACGASRRAKSAAISCEMMQMCLAIIAAVGTILAASVFLESPLVGIGIVVVVAATLALVMGRRGARGLHIHWLRWLSDWWSTPRPVYWYEPAYYYPVFVPDHRPHHPRDGWMRHDRPSRLPDQA